MKLPVLLGNYDKQTDLPTNQPTSLTSIKQGIIMYMQNMAEIVMEVSQCSYSLSLAPCPTTHSLCLYICLMGSY